MPGSIDIVYPWECAPPAPAYGYDAFREIPPTFSGRVVPISLNASCVASLRPPRPSSSVESQICGPTAEGKARADGSGGAGKAGRTHTSVVPVPEFHIDATPVTKAAYAAWLRTSKWRPQSEQNWLADWPSASAPWAGSDARGPCCHSAPPHSHSHGESPYGPKTARVPNESTLLPPSRRQRGGAGGVGVPRRREGLLRGARPAAAALARVAARRAGHRRSALALGRRAPPRGLAQRHSSDGTPRYRMICLIHGGGV
jgi:hypothetical protein